MASASKIDIGTDIDLNNLLISRLLIQANSRDDLATAANLTSSAGYFKNCLGELRTLGLLDEQGRDIRLSMQIYE